MKTDKESLIRKYNVPGPRYTSYPPVPYWDADTFTRLKWIEAIEKSADEEGISIYIHLPYCESLCTFCGCNTRITVNHAVEDSYIDAVLEEWSLYKALIKKQPVIKELHLGGGTPTFFSAENLTRLIKGITSDARIALDPEFGFEGHPANTTQEHLQALYNVGFRRVSFGIQDFDPKVQEVINRKQTFEQVEEVTRCAREIGYTSVNYDVLYGLPLQTLEKITDTMQKVIQLKPDRIAFYSYAHVPWIKPGQRKFTELDLPDDEAKRALYESGRTLLEQAGYREIGMDHFALETDDLYTAFKNKKLHRNFMGYTTGHTNVLIGLGVSSISELPNAYAQNVKTVEEYKALVQASEIPVFKGHFLTREDRIIRKHILNLMCRLQTGIENPSNQCSSVLTGIGAMAVMEKEGLVKIGLHSLEITEKGRPFIRNICMALDARMQKAQTNKNTFSKVI
ncbi:oxygen-independent coproporphyrinogen III oxidase [Cytophaga aurantiaca]|uniref:oxygen-independent coproporphyrinogen III oxidase n=1 Tax=Cytophaga aurantiaca TaxID=29530 RepID=UPI00035F0D96|nr:oxygen-independent coproporphyrinogen III oxidase [Cytophaga aurantiaca]